jgi:hypothetical protein
VLPTGEPVSFVSALPADLQATLDRLSVEAPADAPTR